MVACKVNPDTEQVRDSVSEGFRSPGPESCMCTWYMTARNKGHQHHSYTKTPCPDLFPEMPVLTVKSPPCLFHTIIHENVFCLFSDIALLVINTENEESALY
jgi:hypothetical protein